VFHLQGSELVALILIALVVLGPEKLPDAIRRFGRLYGELKKMSSGFQSELRSALDEPMKEMRETADLIKKSATFTDDSTAGKDGKGETLTDVLRRATQVATGAPAPAAPGAPAASPGAAATARGGGRAPSARPEHCSDAAPTRRDPFASAAAMSAAVRKPAASESIAAEVAAATASPFAAPPRGTPRIDLPAPPGVETSHDAGDAGGEQLTS
jgi:sec-independent protein translocase protein TatB